MTAKTSGPGHGTIKLSFDGSRCLFSELAAAYPLKLLAPRSDNARVAIVYILSYGGGLVGGDRVHLNVEVQTGAALLALTQGSTKVFKRRAMSRASSSLMSTPSSTAATSQYLMVRLKPHAALYLLPDPVTCFEAASYNQIQHFHLEENSSLILLDWVTSGRQSRGEDWAFARYYSVNDVVVNSTRIAKDVMLLENDGNVAGTPVRSTLAHKLAPYSCYGTLILRGPAVKHLIEDLRTRYKELVVFKRRSPDDFIWSLSSLSNDGIVVRMAGKETQDVKNWMCTSLARLRDVVGEDAYRKAFV